MINILAAAEFRRMSGKGKEARLVRIERKVNFLIMLLLGAFGGRVKITPENAETAKGMVQELIALLDDGGLGEWGNEDGDNGESL